MSFIYVFIHSFIPPLSNSSEMYSLQIIGRVEADPDYMPRSMDFGLNEAVFQAKYCQDCPEAFYKIAFLCCGINPDTRYVLLFVFYPHGKNFPKDINLSCVCDLFFFFFSNQVKISALSEFQQKLLCNIC